MALAKFIPFTVTLSVRLRGMRGALSKRTINDYGCIRIKCSDVWVILARHHSRAFSHARARTCKRKRRFSARDVARRIDKSEEDDGLSVCQPGRKLPRTQIPITTLPPMPGNDCVRAALFRGRFSRLSPIVHLSNCPCDWRLSSPADALAER